MSLHMGAGYTVQSCNPLQVRREETDGWQWLPKRKATVAVKSAKGLIFFSPLCLASSVLSLELMLKMP